MQGGSIYWRACLGEIFLEVRVALRLDAALRRALAVRRAFANLVDLVHLSGYA